MDENHSCQTLPCRVNLKLRASLLLCGYNQANLIKRYSTSTYLILSLLMIRYIQSLSFYVYYAHVFLVPNPQSLNVIECPEFQKLLILLWGDIKSLILHRTKLYELVL
jgi:hypothetical protein